MMTETLMQKKIRKTREYLDYIEEHYNNVQKAWTIIQDKCQGKLWLVDDYSFWNFDAEIKEHDLSKLSADEFVQYRESFYSVDEIEKEQSDMLGAWEHHKVENPHHWENWSKKENGFYMDVLHNVIDWMAMGMKFGDTAQSFYEKNKDKIKIPKEAEEFMYEIFECLNK